MNFLAPSNLPKTVLRGAVLYALLGIGMGIVMGAQHDFTNKSVHVHINLLGWVSMAVMGVAYQVFPGMGRSALAKAHFWLHNLGLPVMMTGLYGLMHAWPNAEPLIGIGSLAVALGFGAFALNAWLNAGKAAESADASHTAARPGAASRPAARSALA